MIQRVPMKLIRIEHNETETIGVLSVNGRLTCYVLELPWRDNRCCISRIPAGFYTGERQKDHPRKGLVFHIFNVPGRTEIMMHVGNTHVDTAGCPVPGLQPGYHDSVRGVLDSNAACLYVTDEMGDEDRFSILILDCEQRCDHGNL